MRVASFLLSAAFLSLGCGDSKLTRDRAADVISTSLGFPRTGLTEKFGCARQAYQWNNSRVAEAMLTKGLITYPEVDHQRMNMMIMYVAHSVDLTPEGLKYKVGEVYEGGNYRQLYCIMRVADQAFGTVTGIRETADGTSAEVDYTWQYVNVTPFGELVPLLFHPQRPEYAADKLRPSTIELSKYDDGWRVKGMSSPRDIRTAREAAHATAKREERPAATPSSPAPTPASATQQPPAAQAPLVGAASIAIGSFGKIPDEFMGAGCSYSRKAGGSPIFVESAMSGDAAMTLNGRIVKLAWMEKRKLYVGEAFEVSKDVKTVSTGHESVVEDGYLVVTAKDGGRTREAVHGGCGA